MEFEVTCDQRSGKPIACQLNRLPAGTVSFEVIWLDFSSSVLVTIGSLQLGVT